MSKGNCTAGWAYNAIRGWLPHHPPGAEQGCADMAIRAAPTSPCRTTNLDIIQVNRSSIP